MRHLRYLIPVLAILIIGAGCGKKAAEKAAEEAVTLASNGNVNVKINSNTVTITTNGGSTVGQVGESVKLPDDFPSDVYVITGTITTAVKDSATNRFTVSLETTTAATAAYNTYKTELVSDGWNITASMEIGTGGTISASKDNRTTTVIVGTSDNKTTIMLGTSPNQ